MARREEWQEQKKLARLLDKWLDPACTFWTATDPVASSALSGAIRKQRGVKPGVPDQLILYRGTRRPLWSKQKIVSGARRGLV